MIKNAVACLNNSICIRFEIVEEMQFGNMHNSFNIPKFYSELKIKTAENSEFYLKTNRDPHLESLIIVWQRPQKKPVIIWLQAFILDKTKLAI